MPTYLYQVGEERLEVVHKMSQEPKTWGELCQAGGLPLGQRDPASRVERLIVPVATSISQFTSDIKNSGFQRLERRDSGVYEDVTAPKGGAGRIIDSN